MVTKQPASLTQYITYYAAGAPALSAAFLGGVPALVREDGTILLGPPSDAREIVAHPEAAVLVATSNGRDLLTGGDDGRLVRTDSAGNAVLVHDAKGSWIDAATLRADGACAYAVGKKVFARDAQGVIKQCDVASTARGLCFLPKGYRLAAAHYNGVSLWFPNTATPLEILEWKGSHLDVTVSPDGRFVVSSMQENSLHGWRLADKANMRMSGYPSKVRSVSWSSDGMWLATSGADSCVLWPFRDKDGPMNKNPKECAIRRAKISRVAFHPDAPLLATGYEDGWILLSRITDDTEMLGRRPDADRDAITALAWSADGLSLLFGTAGGDAGLLALPPS